MIELREVYEGLVLHKVVIITLPIHYVTEFKKKLSKYKYNSKEDYESLVAADAKLIFTHLDIKLNDDTVKLKIELADVDKVILDMEIPNGI